MAEPHDSFAPVQPPADAAGFRPVPQPGDEGAAQPIVVVKGPVSPAGSFSGKPAEVAGRYAILRAGGRDSGCLLTLDDEARGPRGSFKAILGPGCGDQGMLIFDPVGWRIEKGRLALIARKGHRTHLDQKADGIWSKDPKEGAPLELKKL